LKQYGDELFCVPYKYNAEKGEFVKTIELAVCRKPWNRCENRMIPANLETFQKSV